MEFSHVPVLYREVLENLAVKEGGIYVDGTLGGGGHAEAVCKALGSEGLFIGIDRDTDALEAAEKRLAASGEAAACKKLFVHDNYANIKKILEEHGIDHIDGALLDLGVSSFQLDNPERGFSYMQDAPLDMRMNQEDRFSAAAEDFLDVLKPDGRLLVITFHSLEDRIIKNVFARRADPCTCPPGLPCVCGKKADIKKITRKPIEASEVEREENPRARSAKLRVAEKLGE